MDLLFAIVEFAERDYSRLLDDPSQDEHLNASACVRVNSLRVSWDEFMGWKMYARRVR